MPPTVFAPSDVIHLWVMRIDLALSMGVPEGAETPESEDEVGAFSDEELIDLPEGNSCFTIRWHFDVICLCHQKGAGYRSLRGMVLLPPPLAQARPQSQKYRQSQLRRASVSKSSR